MQKKYLLITSAYPNKDDIYQNVFVHVRVKEYLKKDLDVEVLVVNTKPYRVKTVYDNYSYEGVKVKKGSLNDIEKVLKASYYDKILIHFAYPSIVKRSLKYSNKQEVIIWCHGADVISWKRRRFGSNFNDSIKFLGYILLNSVNRINLNKIVKKYNYRLTFVFVSKWLQETAEIDLNLINQINNYYIIPNPIECNKFEYKIKSIDDRLNIFSIRSFHNKKYANDLTVKAIIALSKKPYFNELTFTICGKGRLWARTVEPISNFGNIKLYNDFFNHEEIKELHGVNGVMLMPSRQDTHGISTCEGMSSGLVVITSDNSAIPEYVPKDCGYLTRSCEDIVEAIENIYYNPNRYLELSKKGSEYIKQKCDVYIIIEKEVDLIIKE